MPRDSLTRGKSWMLGEHLSPDAGCLRRQETGAGEEALREVADGNF